MVRSRSVPNCSAPPPPPHPQTLAVFANYAMQAASCTHYPSLRYSKQSRVLEYFIATVTRTSLKPHCVKTSYLIATDNGR
eukprot:4962273-Amphidinium_carterae.1